MTRFVGGSADWFGCEALRRPASSCSPRQLRFLFLYPTPNLRGTHVRDCLSFVLAFFLSSSFPFGVLLSRSARCASGVRYVCRPLNFHLISSRLGARALHKACSTLSYCRSVQPPSRRIAADEACRDVALHGLSRGYGHGMDMELLLAHHCEQTRVYIPHLRSLST